MSLLGFALVLAAAFCHATWNFFVKRINGGAELIWLFSALSTVLYLPLALFVLWAQKPALGLTECAFIAGSAALHLFYFLLLQTGYRKGDLSLVYPTARATGPLLSASLAVLLLGETVTVQMGFGAVIIVFGVMMLTGGVRPGARQVPTSLLFGLGAGFLIGSYTAWDAYAVSVLVVPAAHSRLCLERRAHHRAGTRGHCTPVRALSRTGNLIAGAWSPSRSSIRLPIFSCSRH